MGTMKLIAHNGQETKIEFDHISVEDIEEMKKQIKAHENDPPIKFYDYVGLMKVLGEAGWPWVWASIGISFHSSALACRRLRILR